MPHLYLRVDTPYLPAYTGKVFLQACFVAMMAVILSVDITPQQAFWNLKKNLFPLLLYGHCCNHILSKFDDLKDGWNKHRAMSVLGHQPDARRANTPGCRSVSLSQ